MPLACGGLTNFAVATLVKLCSMHISLALHNLGHGTQCNTAVRCKLSENAKAHQALQCSYTAVLTLHTGFAFHATDMLTAKIAWICCCVLQWQGTIYRALSKQTPSCFWTLYILAPCSHQKDETSLGNAYTACFVRGMGCAQYLSAESLMTVVIQASSPGRKPMSPPYRVKSKLNLGISTKAICTQSHTHEIQQSRLSTVMITAALII